MFYHSNALPHWYFTFFFSILSCRQFCFVAVMHCYVDISHSLSSFWHINILVSLWQHIVTLIFHVFFHYFWMQKILLCCGNILLHWYFMFFFRVFMSKESCFITLNHCNIFKDFSNERFTLIWNHYLIAVRVSIV